MAHSACPDLVSIIIPVYNTGALLKETLDSCLNQSYTNLEVLAMDDNSNDPETLEILQAYAQKDPRIKVVRSETNHGVTYGRNHGAEICQGKYFAFLDHDDLLAEDFIERLRNAIIEHKADMAESAFQSFMDADESEYGDDYRLSYVRSNAESFDARAHDLVVFTRKDIIKTGAVFTMTKLCWAKLFVTEKYRKAGLRFEDVRYGEDMDWSIKVFTTLNNFVSVRFKGLRYRLHPSAGSAAGSKGFFKGMTEAWRRIYDYVSSSTELKCLLPELHEQMLSYSFYAYRLLCECHSMAEKQQELKFIKEVYRHCELDLEQVEKDHCNDLLRSAVLTTLNIGLAQGVKHAKMLVVSATALYDPNDIERVYIAELLQHLAECGMTIHAISTNLSVTGKRLASIKNERQELQQFIEEHAEQNLIKSLQLGVGSDSFTTVHGYITHHVLESKVDAVDSERLSAAVQQVLRGDDFANVLLVGRNAITEAVGSKISGTRKVQLVLRADLSDSEKATGQVTNCAWADVTGFMGTAAEQAQEQTQSEQTAQTSSEQACRLDYLLPTYTGAKINFATKDSITLLCPDGEHGLALACRLMMMMRDRFPLYKLLLVQKAHDDLVAKLQQIHTPVGNSMFTEQPDVTKLKVLASPVKFTRLWNETRVLLVLSPSHVDSNGLALDALYNNVPVLGSKDTVAAVQAELPAHTLQDVYCLPPKDETAQLMDGLEQLLVLSENEAHKLCAPVIASYPQRQILERWASVLQVELTKD